MGTSGALEKAWRAHPEDISLFIDDVKLPLVFVTKET